MFPTNITLIKEELADLAFMSTFHVAPYKESPLVSLSEGAMSILSSRTPGVSGGRRNKALGQGYGEVIGFPVLCKPRHF